MKRIDDRLHWYKDAVIYELHIKAFKDGNGDGIGDFEGLMEKLDYLQNLGITAIWLLPFYPSPLKDDGYDIADYYSINTSYGNISQFKKLLKEAHRRNLKVITELVINHTSDQHPWFQAARRAPKGSPERDFYVWTDDPNQYNEVRIIFQDFEKSNWTWDPVAQQYYWHRFFYHQPDLNYDNPAVQAEVFKIIDYWCEMGVDGFRLDAVPYLFERDGTNCENLPETHVFLKKLRKHVDKKYPGTLLLAEANMWPEDSARYFGNGDECHMNYHFPIMPRMFMSLQMEDRYPITDIFDQTPEIPDTCQWGIFLRNHDELTLEMVTDEERDYMYKVYVKDPKARINLGIRHRLAPLMENDRRKIELLNYLLFSLPGTPVIYYGDEIGMGDNFYLGDRDGVRTPMQWSPDRNAGFSSSNPQRLYLPVVTDPLYHFESVNVELQNRNTSSLLWTMKKMISTRKKYRAFGRGKMEFVYAENPRILAFTRTYQDETLLVVVNFSRHAQPVELDMKNLAGSTPVEVFSGNSFPAVKAGQYYPVTLAPYECLWFEMEQKEALTDTEELYVLQADSWSDQLQAATLDELASNVLPGYLRKMRWFGGKGERILDLHIKSAASMKVSDGMVVILLVEASYGAGLPEVYQLPIGFSTDSVQLKAAFPNAIICEAAIGRKKGVLYDALYSSVYRDHLLKQIAENRVIDTGNDTEIVFFGKDLKVKTGAARMESRILSAEQSNSSIIYDNSYFLKVYRKVDAAINPDVEVTRFLSERTTFSHLPAFAGSIEWQSGESSIVLAMMQELVTGSTDGWVFMQDRLKDFNERILAKTGLKKVPSIKHDLAYPVAYEDLPVSLRDLLDPAVAERTRMLGIRTAEMHLALASDTEDPAFLPEPFSLHYQRSLYSSFQTQVRKAYQSLARNIDNLKEDVREEAQQVMGVKDDLLSRFKAIYRKKFDVEKIRIHGDFHLGQTLFSGNDIVILDFEGEPAARYSERRLKRNALRDVAGMIRSFHYAAYGSLFLYKGTRKEDVDRLIPFVELWQRCMAQIYLHAYLEVVKGSALVPPKMEDVKTLLETYILEKAVYELSYEINNRPDWVLIPLRGIKAIMG